MAPRWIFAPEKISLELSVLAEQVQSSSSRVFGGSADKREFVRSLRETTTLRTCTGRTPQGRLPVSILMSSSPTVNASPTNIVPSSLHAGSVTSSAFADCLRWHAANRRVPARRSTKVLACRARGVELCFNSLGLPRTVDTLVLALLHGSSARRPRPPLCARAWPALCFA